MAVIALLIMLRVSPAWATEDLNSLQAAFLRGEYERVFHSAGEGFEQGAVPADGFLYLQGVSALKLGGLPAARKVLNQLLDSHPDSRWAPQAWMALGDSWEAAGDHDTALQVYSRYLEQNRDSSMAPQVLLRVGMIQREKGRWDEAKNALQEVTRRAVATPEAAQAAELLRSGEFYFCIQVGAFSAPANAERLAAELRRRGYAAEVSRTEMNGRIYYRVRVGQSATRKQAEEEAVRLQQDGFPVKVFP